MGPDLEPGAPPLGGGDDALQVALQVVGDRWSLLVVRELSRGSHRFTGIRQHTGAPRETLAGRLRMLEDAGLLRRRRYCERPPRDEYVLTQSGAALDGVLDALQAWGESYGRGGATERRETGGHGR